MAVSQQEQAAAEDEAGEPSGEGDLEHLRPSWMGPPDAAQRQPQRAAWLADIAFGCGSGGFRASVPLGGGIRKRTTGRVKRAHFEASNYSLADPEQKVSWRLASGKILAVATAR